MDFSIRIDAKELVERVQELSNEIPEWKSDLSLYGTNIIDLRKEVDNIWDSIKELNTCLDRSMVPRLKQGDLDSECKKIEDDTRKSIDDEDSADEQKDDKGAGKGGIRASNRILLERQDTLDSLYSHTIGSSTLDTEMPSEHLESRERDCRKTKKLEGEIDDYDVIQAVEAARIETEKMETRMLEAIEELREQAEGACAIAESAKRELELYKEENGHLKSDTGEYTDRFEERCLKIQEVVHENVSRTIQSQIDAKIQDASNAAQSEIQGAWIAAQADIQKAWIAAQAEIPKEAPKDVPQDDMRLPEQEEEEKADGCIDEVENQDPPEDPPRNNTMSSQQQQQQEGQQEGTKISPRDPHLPNLAELATGYIVDGIIAKENMEPFPEDREFSKEYVGPEEKGSLRRSMTRKMDKERNERRFEEENQKWMEKNGKDDLVVERMEKVVTVEVPFHVPFDNVEEKLLSLEERFELLEKQCCTWSAKFASIDNDVTQAKEGIHEVWEDVAKAAKETQEGIKELSSRMATEVSSHTLHQKQQQDALKEHLEMQYSEITEKVKITTDNTQNYGSLLAHHGSLIQQLDKQSRRIVEILLSKNDSVYAGAIAELQAKVDGFMSNNIPERWIKIEDHVKKLIKSSIDTVQAEEEAQVRTVMEGSVLYQHPALDAGFLIDEKPVSRSEKRENQLNELKIRIEQCAVMKQELKLSRETSATVLNSPLCVQGNNMNDNHINSMHRYNRTSNTLLETLSKLDHDNGGTLTPEEEPSAWAKGEHLRKCDDMLKKRAVVDEKKRKMPRSLSPKTSDDESTLIPCRRSPKKGRRSKEEHIYDSEHKARGGEERNETVGESRTPLDLKTATIYRPSTVTELTRFKKLTRTKTSEGFADLSRLSRKNKETKEKLRQQMSVTANSESIPFRKRNKKGPPASLKSYIHKTVQDWLDPEPREKIRNEGAGQLHTKPMASQMNGSGPAYDGVSDLTVRGESAGPSLSISFPRSWEDFPATSLPSIVGAMPP